MSYIPGHRPQRETVTIDYADVLRQAVDNERWRVLREIRNDMERVNFFDPDSRSYDPKPRRDVNALKRDVFGVLDRAGDGS